MRNQPSQRANAPEKQAERAAMVSVFIQCLRATASRGHLPLSNALYKGQYTVRQRNANGVQRRGLDLEGTFKRWGTAWFPANLVDWLWLQKIESIVGQLSGRNDSELRDFWLGYLGLSYNLCAHMLGIELWLSATRFTAKMKIFRKKDVTWTRRVALLFEWDDHFQPRSWDNQPYRQLARHFHGLVLRKAGPALAQQFKANLGRDVVHHLWIIPKYDATKLHMIIKKHPCHSQSGREELAQDIVAERLQWLAGHHPSHDSVMVVNKRTIFSWDPHGWSVVEEQQFPKQPLMKNPPPLTLAQHTHQRVGLR